MEVKDITEEYIKENFYIDKERQQDLFLDHPIKMINLVDLFEANDERVFKNLDEIKDLIDKSFGKVGMKSKTLSKDSRTEHLYKIHGEKTYDYAECIIEVIERTYYKETDDEVVKRLQHREKEKIRKRKRKETQRLTKQQRLNKLKREVKQLENELNE